MKIAFVGKGGSGKSTISSLFGTKAIQANQRVLMIDADLNTHTAQLLGLSVTPPPLSEKTMQAVIKTHLRGNNPRIIQTEDMVKTTPPGSGSYLITDLLNDHFLQTITQAVGSTGRLAVTGTCTENDIGIHCYHKNLAITELLVSHINEPKQDLVILDMVAGVDAFSHTLHAQVDVLLFVVEPTPESVSVAKEYLKLAEAAGRKQDVCFIGNKIVDSADQAFLKKNQIFIITQFPYLPELKTRRQNGQAIVVLEHPAITEFSTALSEYLQTNITIDKKKRLERLWHLHSMYAKRSSTIQKHGDLLEQIDQNFSYGQ